MNTWNLIGICILMLVGCTSPEYQRMQAERDQLLINYEDVREEHNALNLRTGITESLLGKWRFRGIEIEMSGVSQEAAEAKAALRALDLETLVFQFSEERGIYNYRAVRGNIEAAGQFRVETVRYGDEPFPFIRFVRRSGPEIVQWIFAASLQGTPLGLSQAPGLTTARGISVSVNEDRLYFTMHGKMQLSPNGWVQNGGVRCYFKRVRE